jgi:Protein of unknown function (DUF3768).
MLEIKMLLTKEMPISFQNDCARSSFGNHSTQFTSMLTRGVSALIDDENDQYNLIVSLKGFNSFTPDNDPYNEHDFFSFDFKNQKLFFKIDYYDLNKEHGSEDPSDPGVTHRVMTVMCANEY